MKLTFEMINESNSQILHKRMSDYYRRAEDKETPQKEVDTFIESLLRLIQAKQISGWLINVQGNTVGFVLWAIDTPSFIFSEMPDYGTILEIGIGPDSWKQGIGTAAAEFSENEMQKRGVNKAYVCAYGPARPFWEKSGYQKTDRIAKNGLPIYIKENLKKL